MSGAKRPGDPGWTPGEEERERAGEPSRDVGLRALSVVPFVLTAALGVIALVGWIVVIVFGIGAPGTGSDAEPIWRWAQDRSLLVIVTQAVLAIAIGLIPAAIMLAAAWAAMQGFQERPHPLFWPAAEIIWSVIAVALVVMARTQERFLSDIGVATTDWWFAFGLVAFAMILAAARIRRLRTVPRLEGDDS